MLTVTLPPSWQAPHQKTTQLAALLNALLHTCSPHNKLRNPCTPQLHHINWSLSPSVALCYLFPCWMSSLTPFRSKQKALHDSRSALASSDGDLIFSPCQTPPCLPEPATPSLGPWPPHLWDHAPPHLRLCSLPSRIHHQSPHCCLTEPYPRSFSYCVFTPTSLS